MQLKVCLGGSWTVFSGSVGSHDIGLFGFSWLYKYPKDDNMLWSILFEKAGCNCFTKPPKATSALSLSKNDFFEK